MIVSCGSNGDDGPKSITNPVFFCVNFHTTGVPRFTQKSALLLGFAILGVAEAALEVRFTSIVHVSEPDPHVFSALHKLAGFDSEQAYLSVPFLSANANLVRMTTLNRTNLRLAIKPSRFFIDSSLNTGTV